jgi:hypothetical protein
MDFGFWRRQLQDDEAYSGGARGGTLVHWLWPIVGGDVHTEEVVGNIAELWSCDGESWV